MGSIGKSTQTRTQRMVGQISDIVQEWVNDSYMDEDDKELVRNWHDLLEQLNMEASEAREDIIDNLFDQAGTWRFWDKDVKNIPEEDKKLVFMDGEFEDENGNYLKYGEVMKMVKQELVNRGILKVPR